MDAVYQEQGDDAVGDGRAPGGVLQTQSLGHILVMVVDAQEDEDQHRDEDEDEPCPRGELGDGEDQHDDERHARADAADDHVQPPFGIVPQNHIACFNGLAFVEMADAPGVDDHARLRQGEAEEHADGIERDEGGGDGPHDDDQQ